MKKATFYRHFGMEGTLIHAASAHSLSTPPSERVWGLGALRLDVIGIVDDDIVTFHHDGNVVVTRLIEPALKWYRPRKEFRTG